MQRTGIRMCRKNGIRLYFLNFLLWQRGRIQHHDFLNCPHGLMICDQIKKLPGLWILSQLTEDLGFFIRQETEEFLASVLEVSPAIMSRLWTIVNRPPTLL